MCTVSYLPIAGGFLLGSSRDESPTRGPVAFPTMEGAILYPQDEKGGGTWIAVGASGWCLCLLNGAFVKHHHAPPYRKSRGLIVREIAASDDPVQALHQENLSGIEPFTLVMARADKPELWEFRWDGALPHWAVLDPLSPHLWASSTLYCEQMITRRREWFAEFLIEDQPQIWPQLERFHLEGGAQAPDDEKVRMKRPGVESVSVTGLTASAEAFRMDYFDFLTGERKSAQLALHQHHSAR